MTTNTPDLTVTLARLEVKLDQLISSSSDHEIRMRKLEATHSSGKALVVTITNAVLTAITTAMAGTTVLGG
jgi:hypothetical protein